MATGFVRKTPSPSLDQLPEEIQVKILQHCNVKDIVACKKVCRSLTTAAKNIAVQYKLELDIADMIDGPPRKDIAIRLQKLREYQKAWEIQVTPMEPIPSTVCARAEPSLRVYHASTGSGFYFTHESLDEIHWYSPGCALRESKDTMVTIKRKHLPATLRGDLVKQVFAVDCAQDLLVAATLLDDEQSQAHLLSLNGSRYHPHATQSILFGPDCSQQSLRENDEMIVHGTILAWKVQTFRHPQNRQILNIWNWKTGAHLWHMDTLSDDGIGHALLDANHLLLFYPRKDEFCVHRLGRFVDEANNSLLCTFELPPHYGDRNGWSAHSTVGPTVMFNPPLPPSAGETPLFCHNAESSVVALGFYHIYPTSTEWAVENFLLVVPLVTIMDHIRAAAHDAPGVSEGEPQANAVRLPWDQWGERGSRLVQMGTRAKPAWITIYGSKIVIVYKQEYTEKIELLTHILDVYPHAALPPPPPLKGREMELHPPKELFNVRIYDELAQDTKTMPPDVRTTWPCRARYCILRIPAPGFYPRHVYQTADGLQCFCYGYNVPTRSAMGFYSAVYGFSA